MFTQLMSKSYVHFATNAIVSKNTTVKMSHQTENADHNLSDQVSAAYQAVKN